MKKKSIQKNSKIVQSQFYKNRNSCLTFQKQQHNNKFLFFKTTITILKKNKKNHTIK